MAQEMWITDEIRVNNNSSSNLRRKSTAVILPRRTTRTSLPTLRVSLTVETGALSADVFRSRFLFCDMNDETIRILAILEAHLEMVLAGRDVVVFADEKENYFLVPTKDVILGKNWLSVE